MHIAARLWGRPESQWASHPQLCQPLPVWPVTSSTFSSMPKAEWPHRGAVCTAYLHSFKPFKSLFTFHSRNFTLHDHTWLRVLGWVQVPSVPLVAGVCNYFPDVVGIWLHAPSSCLASLLPWVCLPSHFVLCQHRVSGPTENLWRIYYGSYDYTGHTI